jgi:hypothetical protein
MSTEIPSRDFGRGGAGLLSEKTANRKLLLIAKFVSNPNGLQNNTTNPFHKNKTSKTGRKPIHDEVPHAQECCAYVCVNHLRWQHCVRGQL